jgi:hypothetical protein
MAYAVTTRGNSDRAAVTAAVDVQPALTWVFRDQQAHRVTKRIDDRDLRWLQGHMTATALVLERAAQGAIDRSGRDPGRLDPDAEALCALILDRRLGLDRRLIGLILSSALEGEPPAGYRAAWRLGPQLKLIIPGKRGGQVKRIVVVDRDQSRRPISCPLVPDVDPSQVERDRRAFLDWRSALQLIVAQGQQLGLRRRLTGPALPPAPWELDPDWC